MLRLVIFPLLWFAAIIASGLAWGLPFGAGAATLLGWICYFCARALGGTRRRVWRFSSAALVGGVLILIAALSTLATGALSAAIWDPIGENNDVGEAPCSTFDAEPISNGTGIVAVVRKTRCSGGWEEQANFFVFVRQSNAQNSRANLAFRYTPTNGSDEGPRLHWLSDHLLRITIGDGQITQITKQVPSIDDVRVIYSYRWTEHPPAIHWWQRVFDSQVRDVDMGFSLNVIAGREAALSLAA